MNDVCPRPSGQHESGGNRIQIGDVRDRGFRMTISLEKAAATDLVVLLSPSGRPIGTAGKASVHGPDTPYHLAFSCYAFRGDGHVLVTRRAWSKTTWPGVWTNSCCGHPAPGELVADAVTRRLGEELGLHPRALRLALPDFSYRASVRGIVEHELCPVFLCRITEEPDPDPGDVAEYTWMPWSRFLECVAADPSPISPWARLQAVKLAGFVDAFLADTGGQRG
jgi:isopentenyl-diphosphate Delta-isomerase